MLFGWNSGKKEGWPGMAGGHVIIPGTRVGPVPIVLIHFLMIDDIKFCSIEGRGRGWGGGGVYDAILRIYNKTH